MDKAMGIATINDLRVGDRVRSAIDNMGGRVNDVDYRNIQVAWDDGFFSVFAKEDGFVLFRPEAH